MPRTVKKDKHLRPGQPEKPSHLSEQASGEWDRLMAELAASGIQITPGHRIILAQAACICADIADAFTRVKKDGEYIQTKAGLVQHPAGKRMDALRRDLIKVLTMLGLRTAVPDAADKDGPTLEDAMSED